MKRVIGEQALTRNHKWKKGLLFVGIMLPTIAGTGFAADKPEVTAEEILELLKENGVVTQQQYDAVLKKAEARKEEQAKEYTVMWKDGINVNRNDGAFKVKLGGRIHLDWGFASGDSALDRNEANGVYGGNTLDGNGVEFRRARLYLSGTLWEEYLFKAQYDFAGGDADWKDVYMGKKNIPVLGTLLVGQMHEPFSLEELTSSNYITFLERSLPTGAFAPSRKTGIRASNTLYDSNMTWALGVFYGDTDDDGDSNFDDIDNTDLTVRVTGIPIYNNEGEQLLHLGLGYSYQIRDEGETEVRYRNRPEFHMTDVRLVDTGSFDADSVNLLNPELALAWGPYSLQGEYYWTSVDSTVADDPTFQGAYLYGSWFITGEHRPYSKSSGKFSRVKPNNNFIGGGSGAWEIAARWSWLDLTDSNISGGDQNDLTLGVNWYLNPNNRIMFNYVFADVDSRDSAEDGDADIFAMRFQADF